MKKLHKTRALSLLIVLLWVSATACTKNADNRVGNGNSNGLSLTNINQQIYSLPKDSLNQLEKNSLLFTREEEKLARDVYVALYQKWGANIFSNINSSEQTHMDAVKLLLDRYTLTDPAGTPGVFANTNLQSLYSELVRQGEKSLLDAYKVGATIEDLDIYDIEQSIQGIDNKDILLVYASLVKASRNHLRSYYRNIIAAGGSYSPQYISKNQFDSIINSPMETGH